jgi:hypothetical protein
MVVKLMVKDKIIKIGTKIIFFKAFERFVCKKRNSRIWNRLQNWFQIHKINLKIKIWIHICTINLQIQTFSQIIN